MKALKWLTRIGPAFVIAAVVLGPGSLTVMTKLGAAHGYEMLWLPLLTGCLMAGFVTLFMRYGISANKSFLRHCCDTWGRWFAAICGFSMFYICTACQCGNNLGGATAMNSRLTPAAGAGTQPAPLVPAWVWPVVFNAAAITFLFAFRRVYAVLEKMMTTLVAVMLIAFFCNLFLIQPRPSLPGIAGGLVPSLPEKLDWALVAGAVATPFSIVGAIFQTYLVRARGWKADDYGKGVADAASGIGMLAVISMIVLITSAVVLRGQTVRDAADMAGQLAAFGVAARVIFCVGFAAAAFSSFLVNAMIGGTLLSDGVGWSEDINSMPAKICSAASLLIGMAVAIVASYWEKVTPAQAIVLAQAGTLLAVPLAVLGSLLVLLYPKGSGAKPLRLLGKAFVLLGLAVLVALVVYSFPTILAKLAEMFGG